MQVDTNAIREAWEQVPVDISDEDTIDGHVYVEAAREVLGLCDRLDALESEGDRLRADLEFYRKRRGQLVIERDGARAMVLTEFDFYNPDDPGLSDEFIAAAERYRKALSDPR